MKRFAAVLKIVGYVLVYAGLALIAFGIVGTWWSRGFGAVQELLSPFNVINYIAMVATLAPGFLLIWGAEKLREKAVLKENSK